jgi:hypothetical protein
MYQFELPTINSKSYVTLPNGTQLYLVTRYRDKYATIQFLTINSEELTHEIFLGYNPDLLANLNLQSILGKFSCPTSYIENKPLVLNWDVS